MVLTHKGRFRPVKSVKVRSYSGSIVSIRPYYAKPFQVTPEHPILTNKGWIRAGQIGDEYIAYPRLTNHSHIYPRISITYEKRRPGFHKCQNSSHTANYFREQAKLDRNLSSTELRLIGYYLAEGSTGAHHIHLDFGKTEKELGYAKDAASIFKELFSRDASIRRTREGGYQVSFGSVAGAKWFRAMFGKDATQKHIPFSWLHANDQLIIELLRGYFRGDGSHHGNVISFTTVSKTLAYQVKLLFARFEIASSVGSKKGGRGVILGRAVRTNEKFTVRVSRTQANRAFQLLGIGKTITKKRTFKVKALFSGKYLRGSYIRVKVQKKSTANYIGPVYNLEVGEDNSYVGTSCVYHNCSAQILLKVSNPFESTLRGLERSTNEPSVGART